MDNYKILFAKSILNDIKEIIKRNEYFIHYDDEIKINNYFYDLDKIKEVDIKILDVISSFCILDKDIINNKYKFVYDDKEKSLEVLTLYYIALYNDNLVLLNKLMDSNFNFNRDGKLNLFALDKRLSSQFEMDEYIKLLKNNLVIFKNFFESLDSKNNDVDIINRFCYIVKSLGEKFNNDNEYLYVKELFKYFSDEEILNLNNKQRNILNSCWSNPELIIYLIKEYDFDKDLVNWDLFEEDFSIEEILDLSDSNIKAINYMYESLYNYRRENDRVDAINKIKNILKVNLNYSNCLKSVVYRFLTEKQLMIISKEGCDDINWMIWRICCGEEEIDTFSKTLIPVCSEVLYLKDRVKKLV